MTPLLIAACVVLGLAAQQLPLDATLTLVSSFDSIPYANPARRVTGTIEPWPGNRLLIVEFAIGQTPIRSDTAEFLLSVDGPAMYAPIAAGGGRNLTLPFSDIAVGREVGQILPSDAVVAIKRNSVTSLTIEAGPLATVALVFDVPRALSPRALRLPDGSSLKLDR